LLHTTDRVANGICFLKLLTNKKSTKRQVEFGWPKIQSTN
jgi:hypothetical protein